MSARHHAPGVTAVAAEEILLNFSVRIPRGLVRKLRVHAVEHNILIKDFVIAALKEKLARTSRK